MLKSSEPTMYVREQGSSEISRTILYRFEYEVDYGRFCISCEISMREYEDADGDVRQEYLPWSFEADDWYDREDENDLSKEPNWAEVKQHFFSWLEGQGATVSAA